MFVVVAWVSSIDARLSTAHFGVLGGTPLRPDGQTVDGLRPIGQGGLYAILI
jgi:hypothetical protein